ncbi:hypothetical protein CesoFtcFv8_002758 [Champsocephalus esox]|uniref:Uncharacterized protein n=1 Tax=Champsocephalus esox TaxID=159716 RepID=A0AAN8D3R8_9TELE|nr:hypothetical protein CesoFtcFv8_002758 [Champsocephalus esox]
MGAEESCSVTADPFSSPVSLVFVVSDVSTKACPAVRNNKPPPTTGLQLRPPCSTGISATFHPRPCPRLPLTHTHTRGPYCPRGHTPDM